MTGGLLVARICPTTIKPSLRIATGMSKQDRKLQIINIVVGTFVIVFLAYFFSLPYQHILDELMSYERPDFSEDEC